MPCTAFGYTLTFKARDLRVIQGNLWVLARYHARLREIMSGWLKQFVSYNSEGFQALPVS